MIDVYIEKFGDSFVSDFAYSAYEGFSHLSYPIKLFDDVDSIPLRFNDEGRLPLVVGCIESVERFFTRIGVTIPEPMHVPHELMKYAQRVIKYMTLGEFKKNKDIKTPIFIKSKKLKLFPSGVINSMSYKNDLMFPHPDDTQVIVSEVIDIVSEYRCFIRKGKLVGIKNYSGDFKVFPDISYIESMISDYKNSPIAYTMDIGIISSGEVVLVECNDAWSVGTYGLDGETTARFFIDRWIQLTGHIKRKDKYKTLSQKIKEIDDGSPESNAMISIWKS